MNSFIFGQNKAMPDRWREMVLDESTTEQALAKFPNPKADKKDQIFRPLKYNEWFNVKNNKNFRLLHYENIEGFKDVKLFFLDNKLVVIQLEPEKLAASLLPQTYGTDFEVLVSGFDKAVSSKDFEREKGKTYPKRFPTVYEVMHKADKSYIFAGIGNSSFGSILSKSVGLEDDPNSMPGKVLMIQLISRSLENKAATNLLK
jgi:hypothetical protein